MNKIENREKIICRDCIHYAQYAVCVRPDSAEVSNVTGLPAPLIAKSAFAERDHFRFSELLSSKRCGPRARYFKQAPLRINNPNEAHHGRRDPFSRQQDPQPTHESFSAAHAISALQPADNDGLDQRGNDPDQTATKGNATNA